MVDDKPVLPQVYELQAIVNELRAVKIEFPEPFQVGTIIAKLPSTWKGCTCRKMILHNSEDFSLEQIKKYILYSRCFSLLLRTEIHRRLVI